MKSILKKSYNYRTVNDIENDKLRAYNKMQIALNIRESSGDDALEAFIKTVTPRELEIMHAMVAEIRWIGAEAYKAKLMRELQDIIE